MTRQNSRKNIPKCQRSFVFGPSSLLKWIVVTLLRDCANLFYFGLVTQLFGCSIARLFGCSVARLLAIGWLDCWVVEVVAYSTSTVQVQYSTVQYEQISSTLNVESHATEGRKEGGKEGRISPRFDSARI